MPTNIPVETVKDAVTTASVLNHLKNNRLEYLLTIGILHIMGVSDIVISRFAGVCF
jgi:hypothetical protein